ncbi:MAG: hypothetical protein WBI21_07695 [Natronincolaceae bacterium]|jgi:hypothetical protein|nr:hypothetical protein [Bacillota bacterium]NLK90579.1 hypothetical protein [Clostridiales bacterium]
MNIFIKNVFLFFFIYSFCFLGAFSKDLLDAFLNKTSNILIVKILLSAFFISIIIYGFSEWILIKLPCRFFTALCYTSGLVSFELFAKYNNTEEFINLIKKYEKLKNFCKKLK